jgi:hypothetical protein
MAEPAIETKDTAKKMSLSGVGKSLLGGTKKASASISKLFSKKPTSELVVDEKLTSTEYLGEIYKMMKVMDEDKKFNQEKVKNHLEEEEHNKDQRNKEIIQALTGKKFKKTKFKAKRKQKKRKGKVTNISDSEESSGVGLATLGVITMGAVAAIGVSALVTSSSSAFANTMAMEQRAKNREEALSAVYKVAKDRDDSLSYGVIGLSSIRTGGKNNSSLDSFIADNPQFNLPDPGDGGKKPGFLESWKKIPAEELLAAQEKWYQDHVYNPATQLLESSGVDSKISADDRVRAYMSDRANQVGTNGTATAIKNAGADKATSAEDFIQKMSEHDIKTLDEQFPKYLKQHPTHRKGLVNRIRERERLSLGVQQDTGEKKSSTLNFKLYPKQSRSAKSQDLGIKDTTPTITDEQLEKQRLEYERQAENGMDMGLKLTWPEQKSSNSQDLIEAQRKSAGLESTGPIIPKSTKAPPPQMETMTDAEREKYIQKYMKAEENYGPKTREEAQSKEDREFWQLLELQDLIDKSTRIENIIDKSTKLQNAQTENTVLREEEVDIASQEEKLQIVEIFRNNEPIYPEPTVPAETFDPYDDKPVILEIHRVTPPTSLEQLTR